MYDDPLSKDPAEAWRQQREKDGFRPYRDLGPSDENIPYLTNNHLRLASVTVWVGPGRRYALRLTGNRYHANKGRYLEPYGSELLLNGWFRFRRSMLAWGYSPPFWWWQKWPT